MKLTDLIVPTAIAVPGMKVEALFRECADKQVPGIPFRAEDGHITGKASIRHILKMNCIPDYMVKHASILGDQLESLSMEESKAKLLLQQDVAGFVLSDIAVIHGEASVAKALAVMEQHNTTYLFVINGEDYLGTVSIMGIGEAICRFAES